MFDSRLFNQSAGMDSGFRAEDDYSVYSKPLFDRKEAGSIYRPKQSEEVTPLLQALYLTNESSSSVIQRRNMIK